MNWKMLFWNYQQSCEDIEKNAGYVEKMGKVSLYIVTAITILMTVGYLAMAGTMGVIWWNLAFVLIISKLVSHMLEYMCLEGTIKFKFANFVYNKVQNIASIIVSLWVGGRLAMNLM